MLAVLYAGDRILLHGSHAAVEEVCRRALGGGLWGLRVRFPRCRVCNGGNIGVLLGTGVVLPPVLPDDVREGAALERQARHGVGPGALHKLPLHSAHHSPWVLPRRL